MKKQKTRKTISDMATRLFIERGYDNVTTAEVAEKAEVSVPTLFNYFPTKEALVFDEDSEVEAALVAAVTNRKKGQTILDALYEFGLMRIEDMPDDHKKNFLAFSKLIVETPELSAYSQRMWMRYEKALAGTLRKESRGKLSPLEAGSLARWTLDSYHRAFATSRPKASLETLFGLLRRAWPNSMA